MQQTLSSYQEQETQLGRLVSLGRRTRLQLDETLAAMGTIYSQLQVLDAMDVDNSQLAHIQEDIRAQASELGDLLAAVAEVRGANGPLPARDRPSAG
jgi:hypothetical protein